MGMLQLDSAIPLHVVVHRVAGELFKQEVAAGGWLVDLGLFGSTLFVPEVLKEIQAADGTLWQIRNSSNL
jgi:hypothetical protein